MTQQTAPNQSWFQRMLPSWAKQKVNEEVAHAAEEVVTATQRVAQRGHTSGDSAHLALVFYSSRVLAAIVGVLPHELGQQIKMEAVKELLAENMDARKMVDQYRADHDAQMMEAAIMPLQQQLAQIMALFQQPAPQPQYGPPAPPAQVDYGLIGQMVTQAVAVAMAQQAPAIVAPDPNNDPANAPA